MENEIVCIICFDNFTKNNPHCINPIECACKFDIHEECWLKWASINEVILECPLCHKYIDETDEETDEEPEEVPEEVVVVQNQEIQPNNRLHFFYIIKFIISIKIIYMSIKLFLFIIGYILLFFF